MFKFVKKILIVFCLLNFNKVVIADIPHYLDFKYILNESTAGKKAQEKLKNKLESGIKGLNKKEKSIQLHIKG